MPSSRFFMAVLLAALAARPCLAGEPPVSVLQGTLEVAIEDDFERGTGRVVYALLDDEGRRTHLSFATPQAGLRTGMRLTLTGRMREGVLAVDPGTDSGAPSRSPAGRLALAGGPRSVLVILLNFPDDASQPYLVSTVQDTVFGTGASVGAFYSENSFGQTTLTGTVTNWLTATVNKPATCDAGTIQSQAESRAAASGYTPSSYQYHVYVFPYIGSCGWAGLGVVGGSGAWINQSVSTYVVGHELGHNFGVLHAHSLDCGGQPIGTTCSRSEYGDPFDIMGGAPRHFSAYHKSALGFLPAGTVTTQSSGNVTHTLSALESPGAAKYAVQVPTSVSGRTYWVEFRQSTGFDAGFSGALVHLGPSDAGGTDLLDMTPFATPGGFGDAALPLGEFFSDSAAGLTITPLSQTATTLTVQVQFVATPPAASFSFSPAAPSAGHVVTFSDSSIGIPSSWTWSFGDGTGSTARSPQHWYATGGTYAASLIATSPSGASSPATQMLTVSPAVPSSYVPLAPCRLVDTRNPSGSYGGPALGAGTTRAFVVRGHCGVPVAAKSVAANVTVTGPTAPGYVVVYPGGSANPGTSTLNFRTGQTKANNVVVELGASGDILVTSGIASGSVHAIVDLSGYFQ